MLLHVDLVELDVRGLDGQLAALRHGVAGVDGQVHQDLFDLAGVGPHRAQSHGRPDGELDVLADEAREHLAGFFDEVVQVEHPRLQNLLSAEGQQLPGERRRALPGLLDLHEVRPQRVARRQRADGHFAVGEDDGQQVVEVVGHAAGQSPHRFHLLRLPELLLALRQLPLHVLAPADVRDQRDALRPLQHRHAEQDRHARAVLAEQLLLAGSGHPSRRELLQGARVALPPLGRRQGEPVQAPGLELLARIAEHLEVGVVGLDHLPLEIPDDDPGEPGLGEAVEPGQAPQQRVLGLRAGSLLGLLERLLELPALGDVARHGDELVRPDQGQDRGHRDFAAILGPIHCLHRLSGRLKRHHGYAAGRDEQLGGLADDLLRPVAEDSLRGRIPAGDPPGAGPADDGVPGGTDQRVQLRAGFIQPDPVADLAGDFGGPDDLAPRRSDWGERHRHVDVAAVFPPAHRLELFERLAFAEMLQDRALLLLAARRNEQGDGPPDHLGRCVAEDALGAAVPAGDRAVESLPDDGVRGALDDGAQAQSRLVCSEGLVVEQTIEREGQPRHRVAASRGHGHARLQISARGRRDHGQQVVERRRPAHAGHPLEASTIPTRSSRPFVRSRPLCGNCDGAFIPRSLDV